MFFFVILTFFFSFLFTGGQKTQSFFIPFNSSGICYASIILLYVDVLLFDLERDSMGGNERFFHAIDSHGKRYQEMPLGRDNFYSFAKLFALMVGYPMCWTFGVCEIFCQTIFIFRISFLFLFLGSYLEKIWSYWSRRFRNVGHFRCRYLIFCLDVLFFCLIFLICFQKL